MPISGSHTGELQLVARLHDALTRAQQRTPGCALVIVRLLVPRSAQALKTEERLAALVMLSERVHPQIRTEDWTVDAVEGLGVIVCSGHPEAARTVAERLRDALLPPRSDSRRVGRPGKMPRAECAIPAEAQQLPRLRLSVGYSTLEGGDLRSGDAAIHAAWKPRMLLSLPLSTLCAADTAKTEIASTEQAELEARSPDAQDQVDVAAGDASDEPAVQPETERVGAPCLRLVRRDSPFEQQSQMLRARAQSLGVPFVRLPGHLPASCRRALNPRLARELRAVAIGRSRATLTVAMEDPSDANAVLRLQAATGLAIFPVLASAEEIDRALGQLS